MATATRGSKKVAEVKKEEVLAHVANVKVTDVTQELGAAQVAVQRTFADLQAQIVDKRGVLTDIEKAIEFRKKELQDIFAIQALAGTSADLEQQIAEQRKLLEKEQDDWEFQKKEYEADREKNWKREEADYKYNTEAKRRKETDDFNAALALRKKQFDELLEQQTKLMNDRDAALKSKEEEFNQLKAKVASWDAELKKAVDKAEAIVANTLKKDYEAQMKLQEKEVEMAKALARKEVESIGAENDRLSEQITNLNEQLLQARADAKDTATEALRAASGQQALQVAMRQGNNDQQQQQQGKK